MRVFPCMPIKVNGRPLNLFLNFRDPGGSVESQLFNDLKRRCEALGSSARPIGFHNETMEVYFGLRLIQFDMDEARNTLTISTWVRIVSSLVQSKIWQSFYLLPVV